MTDEKEINLEELLVQVRRIEAHREKGAETQIQRVYKDLLKNLQGFVGEYYAKYADKNDSLSYEILQQKGKFARFIEEVEQRVNGLAPQIKKVIEKTVADTYKACYQGMEQAVKEADTPALRKAVKDLTSVDAETIKRAVENPISGLTLKDTLEKNRKDIIYDIKRNIGVGLMNGDRYSSMARRISDSVDGDYVKAIRIVRTECKRSDERGKLDFYLQLDKKLQDGNTGKRVKKTWRTKKDERVRPKRGISKGKSKNGANHERMEGVTLLVDELFDLGRAKTLCPGNSGDASNDINCRCRLSYSIVELENTAESAIIKAEKFAPAKTVKAANEYAQHTLKIPHADYSGVEVSVANEWNKGLFDSFQRFPELRDNFDFVGTCQGRNIYVKQQLINEYLAIYKKNNPSVPEDVLLEYAKRKAENVVPKVDSRTYAQSLNFRYGKGVTLNKVWGKRDLFESELKQNVAAKFHPKDCDTVRSVLDHEVGHQIDDLLDICRDQEMVVLFASMQPNDITDQVSRYAWDNDAKEPIKEFIAEAWAEYCNSPTPRSIAQKIGEIIEKRYAEWKKSIK